MIEEICLVTIFVTMFVGFIYVIFLLLESIVYDFKELKYEIEDIIYEIKEEKKEKP